MTPRVPRKRPHPDARNTRETLAEIQCRHPEVTTNHLYRCANALLPIEGQQPSLRAFGNGPGARGKDRYFDAEQRRLLAAVCTFQTYTTMRYEHLVIFTRLAATLGLEQSEMFELLVDAAQEVGVIPPDLVAQDDDSGDGSELDRALSA